MVRALVATMLKAGRGKMSMEEFRSVIEAKDCTQASFAVPPQGLFLVSVDYGNTYFEWRLNLFVWNPYQHCISLSLNIFVSKNLGGEGTRPYLRRPFGNKREVLRKWIEMWSRCEQKAAKNFAGNAPHRIFATPLKIGGSSSQNDLKITPETPKIYRK
jgi:tRNA pseudouridine synthase